MMGNYLKVITKYVFNKCGRFENSVSNTSAQRG